MEDHSNLSTQKDIISVVSPARTCLFGDHQDYLHLPVIACAINRYIKLQAVAHETPVLSISLPDIDAHKTIALDTDFSKGIKGDHLLSAYKVFKMHGGVLSRGYRITLGGNVAINAGISSSSAVVVAWVKFLIKASSNPLPDHPEFIAQLAYEAEVIEQGSPGGRMDQYSISLGHIMYLETFDGGAYTLFHKEIPGLIVGESGIPKPTLSLLGDLRSKAWNAIGQVRKKMPGFDISAAVKDDLPELLPLVSEDLREIFKAAVLNHEITRAALKEFAAEQMNPVRIGALMNAHHQVLKELLGITVPRIDHMIDAANNAGALGAKIVGSGLGGSIIALAPEGKEEKVINAIIDAGGRDAYAVKVDQGVRTINNQEK